MANPVVYQKTPINLTLEPGKYYWCACGKSGNQPFCDGSHKDSEFTPNAFDITEKKEVWLCACKNSSNPPFCDGTHKRL